jgi:hypothetical protein
LYTCPLNGWQGTTLLAEKVSFQTARYTLTAGRVYMYLASWKETRYMYLAGWKGFLLHVVESKVRSRRFLAPLRSATLLSSGLTSGVTCLMVFVGR